MTSLLLALIINQSIVLPENITGRPGAFITIEAKTECKVVEWVLLDSGLEMFPVNLLANTKTAVVTSTIPGVYRLLAYGALGDIPSKPVIVTITIGTPEPPPPDKSELYRRIETLFKADTDAEKVTQARAYAGVFRALAQAAAEEKVKTAGELFKIGSIAASNVLTEKQITTIRDEIGGYLNSKLNTEVAHLLTDADRKKCASEFLTIAKILEVLK
jgi:hypothetical protein